MVRELTFEEWLVHIRKERGYSPETIRRYAASIGIAEGVPRNKLRPARVRKHDTAKEGEDNPRPR